MLNLLPPSPPPPEFFIDPGVARAAFALARHVPSAPNRTFSPLSAWTALRMLHDGTAGITRDELKVALGGEHPREEARELETTSVKPFFAALTLGGSLRLANALWTAPGIELKPSYVTEMRGTFGAIAKEVQGDPLPFVNAWAAEATEGRIPKILDRVDPTWTVILTNAFLYKGAWGEPFDPKQTRTTPFRTAKGKAPVAMMHREDRMTYTEYAGAPAVRLPLSGDTIFLAVQTPEGADPWEWIARAGWEGYRSHFPAQQKLKVLLSLPRMEQSDRLDLIPALKAAGVRSIFERGDFRPMILRGEFGSVDQAVQRTVFALNESGAEAGSVTAISGSRGGPSKIVKEPVILNFDRPFAYFLIHGRTGAPLVMGAYGGPPER